MGLEKYIDHTLLNPAATEQEIIKLCLEAKRYKFYGVCINGCYVSLVKKELLSTSISIVAVIGFPLGAMSTASKIFEAQDCIDNGTNEIDMVLNIGWLKSKKYDLLLKEITAIKQAIGSIILKVIIETCFLNEEEKLKACDIIIQGNADYVKTSTGFGTGGATYEDVDLLKNKVGNRIKIKASGGIKNRETALKYIDLGVSRIGTSSGIHIIEGL